MTQQIEHGDLDSGISFRDKYRSTLKWVICLSVLAVLLAAIRITMQFTSPESRYYATTVNGQVIPLHSLSEPVITNKFLLQWSEIAARTAYNFDFAHYKEQLAQAAPYFNEGAWTEFNKALKKEGLLTDVINKKLVMSSVVSGAPVILSQSVVDGRYTWTIQMPLLLSFDSASEHRRSHLLITMTVSRVSVMTAAKGIQITSFQSSEMN